MTTIQVTTSEDHFAVISLDRGKANAINSLMLKELTSAVQQIEADNQIKGLILTGKENFFSAGIDLIEVYHYNEAESYDFWSGFLNLQVLLADFKKPLVAAISGHSPAGGCVLALCCDYRLMVKGDFVIGLNEVPVGIIVPDAIFHLYAFWLGQRKAYQYLLEGKLMNTEEAFQIGLVDEICPAEDLMETARRKLSQYLKMNQVTWRQSKVNLRKELISKINNDHTEALNTMLKQWWAPETRAILELAIQKLKPSATVSKN